MQSVGLVSGLFTTVHTNAPDVKRFLKWLMVVLLTFRLEIGLNPRTRTGGWLPNELVLWYTLQQEMEIHRIVCCDVEKGGQIISEAGVRGIDLFKIAGESISGWIPSWKTGSSRPSRQPFCSLMEERLLLYLEYHPQIAWYGRGDISAAFASTYKVATPLPTPFTINYLFEGKAQSTFLMPSASFRMAPC